MSDPNAVEAFLTSLSHLPPDAPTACAGWTSHEVAAHLAAGIEEVAELVDDAVSSSSTRPTRGFEEREAPYRAMPDAELRERLAEILGRATTAIGAQDESGITVQFFGRAWTAAEFQAHTAAEFALHRWDLIGDDELGERFLSPPELTAGAVTTLNLLDVLAEAPTARVADAGLGATTVVLRSPDRSDVMLTVEPDGRASFSVGAPGIADGDLVVTTDAVNRLLTLWGRRSADRSITVTGDPALWPPVAAALWGNSPAWGGAQGS